MTAAALCAMCTGERGQQGEQPVYTLAQIVADGAERLCLGRVVALYAYWIRNTPVQLIGGFRPCWALLACEITNGHDDPRYNIGQGIKPFRPLIADIHTSLRHHLDG